MKRFSKLPASVKQAITASAPSSGKGRANRSKARLLQEERRARPCAVLLRMVATSLRELPSGTGTVKGGLVPQSAITALACSASSSFFSARQAAAAALRVFQPGDRRSAPSGPPAAL